MKKTFLTVLLAVCIFIGIMPMLSTEAGTAQTLQITCKGDIPDNAYIWLYYGDNLYYGNSIRQVKSRYIGWSSLPTTLPYKICISSSKDDCIPIEGYTVTASESLERITLSDWKTRVITITFKLKHVLSSLSGNIIWKDDDDRDGIRPQSITLKLSNGRTIEGSAEEVCAKILDLLSDGQTDPSTTTVELPSVNGYTAEINDSGDIVLTHTPATTNISGTITWADNNNRDGFRPDSVTVYLKNGDTVVETAPASASNNWSYTFSDVYKNENGEKIEYTIDTEVVADYGIVIDDYDITYTHEPETISISVQKTWIDDNNRDGKRPDSITVRLWKVVDKELKEVDSKTVTAADDWTSSFDNLYKNENGQPIEYKITEDAVDGYTTTIEKVENDEDLGEFDDKPVLYNEYAGEIDPDDKEYGEFYPEDEYDITYHITNTHEPETVTISITHKWEDDDDRDGLRPKGFNGIYSGVVNTDGAEASKYENIYASNGWTKTFTVNKYADGKELNWDADESFVSVDGYNTVLSGNATDGFVFTHTHVPETVTITGQKTWVDDNDRDGKRPEEITVRLWKVVGNGLEEVEAATVTENDGWEYKFEVFKYENGGHEVIYSITEDAVEYYTTVVDGYNITNSYTPEKTYVFGQKIWKDDNDRDGLRPDSITVYLLANGEVIDKQKISVIDNWSYLFDDLHQYSDGKRIVYSVTEDPVDGYTTIVSGYNIINTHDPATVTISGSKTWKNDDDDANDTRPSRITIRLLADGKEVQKRIVTKESDWTWTFEDVPVYSNGNKIEYTITEDVVVGYDSEINGFDVTNTYRQKTTGEPVDEPVEDDPGTEPDDPTGDSTDEPVTEPVTDSTDEPVTEPTEDTGDDQTKVTPPATSDSDIAIFIALLAASIGVFFVTTTRKKVK